MCGIPAGELDAVATVASEREFAEGEAQVGPGDVIGEVAAVASGRRTSSVVATAPMRTISVFKRDAAIKEHATS